VLERAVSRDTDPFAIGAGSFLLLVASVILHDTGMRTKTIVIGVVALPVLTGVYVLLLWLSLRSWDGPAW
jgi:hypothetical protein